MKRITFCELIIQIILKIQFNFNDFIGRNSPIPCNLMADMDVAPWASDSPAMQVPDDLLRQSIQRAMVDIALRRETVYNLFKTSN